MMSRAGDWNHAPRAAGSVPGSRLGPGLGSNDVARPVAGGQQVEIDGDCKVFCTQMAAQGRDAHTLSRLIIQS